MLVGALTGYSRSAYAQQVCLRQGATSTFLCNGSSSDTQDLTSGTTGVNNTNVISDSIPPQFSVDTRPGYGGSGGNAVSITGDGALSYTDANASSLAAQGSALYVNAAGDDGATPGSITINTNGALLGGDWGIRARNFGTGALTVTANGDVTGTARAGIEAYNNTSATDLTVTAGATVMGGTFGIYAFNNGSGFVEITANGGVAATVEDGIRAESGGTDLTVTAGAMVTGGKSGIAANNFGTGATKIIANGGVTGTAAYGIHVENSATATDLTVTAHATAMGGQRGILTRNEGSGATKITANGDVTGTARAGIEAYNNTSATDLTVTAGATVMGGTFGIYAFNNGSGFVDITANGDVIATDPISTAIAALNQNGTGLTVTTAAGTKVSSDGKYGISARNYGGGALRITANGDVTTATNIAIYARTAGTPIFVTVGSQSHVTNNGNGFAVGAGYGPASVTVAGTLNGGTGGAVAFDQTNPFANRLTVQPGFAINGKVFAGPGANDTLAFGGSGTDAFNLGLIDTGAGTKQYQNFEMFEVDSGTWSFSGATSAAFTVNGGTLKGTGTFGGLTVNGGTVAPGNSIGTMHVNGAFTLGSGAIYEVEANAQGQSDKVIVKGSVNLTGATLRVLEAAGAYKPKTNYMIIDNDGTDAVKGTFAKVTNSLAFLIPSVSYNGGTGNDVVLSLERNATLFQDVAKTKNQKAVAGALDRFPTDNPLFLSVLNQTASGARQAFDALSGEVHATVAGTLVDDSRYVREAVLGRMTQASHQGGALGNGGPQTASYDSQAMMLGGAGMYEGKSLVDDVPQSSPLAFWTQGYGAWGTFDGDGNAATADRDLGGFISGMDADVGQAFWGRWRVGVATGASFSNVSVDQRYSGANTKTYHLGGYVNGGVSGFALRGGGLWARSEIETSRAVLFPNFFERQKADYDADTGQLFGEIAYPTQMAGVELEPFAGLAYVSVESGGFREKGGPQASLKTSGFDLDVGYTTVGLRAAKTMLCGAMEITPHVSAAWLHAFDDVTPDAGLAFATTGIGFDVAGVPLAEDSALLDAGLDLALKDRLSAGVSYSGQYADNVSDNAVKGRFTWRF